jgi:RimJ/RimL family protein N-acetyltransferase
MLVLEQYEVKLTRLTLADIELVRKWRNSCFVNSKMLLSKKITKEEQLNWFQKIDNAFNYYFIIEFEQEKVGLISAKNFNPDFGFGEGGIFIGEPKYESSFAAVYASLCLLNFVFYGLETINKSCIRIRKDNERAIQYNKLLGYRFVGEDVRQESVLLELSREDFLTKGLKLNKAAHIFCEEKSALAWKGTESEKNLPEINSFLATKKSPWAIPDFHKL